MFVVICYLNAVTCIWTNFCDVISILSPKQLQLAVLMKLTFWFCWNYCSLMDWSVLLNLCLFAIQNCFLTFIRVLVNRQQNMIDGWIGYKDVQKECLHFSRTMRDGMYWNIAAFTGKTFFNWGLFWYAEIFNGNPKGPKTWRFGPKPRASLSTTLCVSISKSESAGQTFQIFG